MDLHKEFRKLAFDINKMKNRLMMLLLEIYEKEIYKKQGCQTIYEYGFKYAKLSRETVQLALRTLKNVEDKPFLREKIETQGIYKVSMVAKLATPETDKIYAEHVENMPKPVLFEFAKEMRNGNEKCQAITAKMTIELDEETQILFNQLKRRYAENLSNREALKIILQNAMEQKRLERPDVPGNVMLRADESQSDFNKNKSFNTTNKTQKIQKSSDAANPSRCTFAQIGKNNISDQSDTDNIFIQSKIKINSRTVLTQKKKEVHQKTNGKCSYPNCTRPIENIHHTVPFSFNRSHVSIIGLCKIHHEFCHNGIIRNGFNEPSKWKIALNPDKSLFDALYLKYKTAAG